MGKKPSVLICDLGNVIIYFDHTRIYDAISARLNISRNKVVEKLEKTESIFKYEKGGLTDEEFYHEILSVFNVSRKQMPYDFFTEMWTNIFRPNNEMIAALKLIKKEVTPVLLSNTGPLHFIYIKERWNDAISPFGERLVLSYREGVRKPDRKIFEKAVQMAGKNAAFCDCLYVDDLPEFVKAAEKLGMKGIVFNNYPQFACQMREEGIRMP